jgi:5-methylcytosine-specific restriction endonuclease McrA
MYSKQGRRAEVSSALLACSRQLLSAARVIWAGLHWVECPVPFVWCGSYTQYDTVVMKIPLHTGGPGLHLDVVLGLFHRPCVHWGVGVRL